jgi:hypothetical protein
MTRVISVEPFGEGWSVRTDTNSDVKHFSSGREAEGAARRLAERFGNAGQSAEIQIWLRDGTMAGRFVCPPPSMGSAATGERSEQDRRRVAEPA